MRRTSEVQARYIRITDAIMRSYAFHIQKGGVGKTTISGNAASLVSEPHRVVLIDCDPRETHRVGSSPTLPLTN